MFTSPSAVSFVSRANEYGSMIERGAHRQYSKLNKLELVKKIADLDEKIKQKEIMYTPAHEWKTMRRIAKEYLEKS